MYGTVDYDALVSLLGELYSDPSRARWLLRRAGLDSPARSAAPREPVEWRAVVRAALERERVVALLDAVAQDHPASAGVDRLRRRLGLRRLGARRLWTMGAAAAMVVAAALTLLLVPPAWVELEGQIVPAPPLAASLRVDVRGCPGPALVGADGAFRVACPRSVAAGGVLEVTVRRRAAR